MDSYAAAEAVGGSAKLGRVAAEELDAHHAQEIACMRDKFEVQLAGAAAAAEAAYRLKLASVLALNNVEEHATTGEDSNSGVRIVLEVC